jgi:hypothetical protein
MGLLAPLPVRRPVLESTQDRGPLKLTTTMATWCDACKGELPQLKRLRAAFAVDDLELLGPERANMPNPKRSCQNTTYRWC